MHHIVALSGGKDSTALALRLQEIEPRAYVYVCTPTGDEPGVSIPFRLDCQRCFFQTLYEWWLLWRDSPDVFAEAEKQEAMTGHTFRSAQRDTWPAALKDLRCKFEQGCMPKPRGSALRRLQCRVCTL